MKKHYPVIFEQDNDGVFSVDEPSVEEQVIFACRNGIVGNE
jgi:hypothetical protein